MNVQIVMVAINDYGMRNIKSVGKAADILCYDFEIINSVNSFDIYDNVILPGLGSYGFCIQNLQENGLDILIDYYEKTGKPFLWILSRYAGFINNRI